MIGSEADNTSICAANRRRTEARLEFRYLKRQSSCMVGKGGIRRHPKDHPRYPSLLEIDMQVLVRNGTIVLILSWVISEEGLPTLSEATTSPL